MYRGSVGEDDSTGRRVTEASKETEKPRADSPAGGAGFRNMK